MNIGDYEVMEPLGFTFERAKVNVASALAKADFGDGYGRAAVIGSTEGLRSWQVKIDVLPDLDEYSVESLEHGVQSRANYLWDLFLRSKAAGNKPFWIQDIRDGLYYLAEFAADELDYGVLCGRLYSTGLNLKQRRVPRQTSPIQPEQVFDNPQQI